MVKLVVVADDLTGAMDTGLQFSKRGVDTAVSMSPDFLPDADVAVLDTDSRACRASLAYARLRDVAQRTRGLSLYKKVDSTVRGNVGYELRALWDELRPSRIVVAPAFPPGGRTTLAGRQRVHGQPLELTAFARDPRWPMTESHLPTRLMQQSGLEVGQIDLDALASGPEALVDALLAASEPILVVDAVTAQHLEVIAQALVRLVPDWLPCGSAGLAEPLALALGLVASGPLPGPEATGRPLLLVSGSRHEVTQEQVQRAVAGGMLARIDMDPYRLYDWENEAGRLARACLEVLQHGRDVVLTSSFVNLVAGGGGNVSRTLAEATRQVIQTLSEQGQPPGGLILTGGDIAVATSRALRVKALRIAGELQPGVPGGRFVGGACDGLWVVTKAGGFGDPDALCQALAYLRGD